MNNWGGLRFFLLLFPAGIFIWAAGERRRRAAMPPGALNQLEAEENYGPIDKKLECMFCHSKNCVRTETKRFMFKETKTKTLQPVLQISLHLQRQGQDHRKKIE